MFLIVNSATRNEIAWGRSDMSCVFGVFHDRAISLGGKPLVGHSNMPRHCARDRARSRGLVVQRDRRLPLGRQGARPRCDGPLHAAHLEGHDPHGLRASQGTYAQDPRGRELPAARERRRKVRHLRAPSAQILTLISVAGSTIKPKGTRYRKLAPAIAFLCGFFRKNVRRYISTVKE